MKNMHGYEIVVDADRSDWGKKWGIAPKDDKRCWCYSCTTRRLKEAREKDTSYQRKNK